MCGEQLQWQFYIAVAKDIIVAGASIVAAAVAIIGLKTWRKQLTATANAEVSRALLRAIYHIQEGVLVVRESPIAGGEIASAFKELQIDDADVQQPDFAWKAGSAVYQVRFGKLAESVSEMRSAMIEAEVLWGREIEGLCDPLLKKVSQLRGAIRVHLRSLKDGRSSVKDKDLKKIDEVLFDMGDKDAPDQFTREINDMVKAIEESLRKRLPFEKAN
jgi:hypothetical protein